MTSTVIFFDRSPFATAVVTSAMLRTCAVRLPAIEFTLSVRSFHDAGDALHRRLATELALGAHFARDARHLGGEGAELLDHPIDGLGGAHELALERPIVDLERHRLRQVTLGDRADHPRGLGGRLDEVGHQAVHVGNRAGPRARDRSHGGALVDLPLAADDHAQPRQLRGQALVHLDDFVERVRDLAGKAGPRFGESGGEVPLPNRLERAQKDCRVDRTRTFAASVSRSCLVFP